MDICVITGGAGGMGLELAKLIGREKKIILVDCSSEKLEKAKMELKFLNIDADIFVADVCDKKLIKELVKFSKEKGNIKIVIHTAGISPKMGNANHVFNINALGTINVNEEFLPEMKQGGVLLNVSSMAAHLIPPNKVPIKLYKTVFTNKTAFIKRFHFILSTIPSKHSSNAAYALSKSFVKWYSEQMALKYGKNGIRVVSISPGTISTPMGKIEGENAENIAKMGALGRVGNPKEIAKMMKFIISDECSYLSGVDILYDGGTVAAYRKSQENKKSIFTLFKKNFKSKL